MCWLARLLFLLFSCSWPQYIFTSHAVVSDDAWFILVCVFGGSSSRGYVGWDFAWGLNIRDFLVQYFESINRIKLTLFWLNFYGRLFGKFKYLFKNPLLISQLKWLQIKPLKNTFVLHWQTSKNRQFWTEPLNETFEWKNTRINRKTRAFHSIFTEYVSVFIQFSVRHRKKQTLK